MSNNESYNLETTAMEANTSIAVTLIPDFVDKSSEYVSKMFNINTINQTRGEN